MMTYSEAFTNWNESIRPEIVEQYGESDTVALSESWNDYTDSLCKDGELTDLQYQYCPSYDDDIPEDIDDERDYILEALSVHIDAKAMSVRTDGLMADMPRGSSHWLVTIKRGEESFSLQYSMGPAHKGTPDHHDILNCVLSDISYVDRDFEDFCNDLGYDPDSKTADKIYSACREQAAQMHDMFSSDEIEGLQALYQDY